MEELDDRVVAEEQLEPFTNIHGHILYEQQQLLREVINILRQHQLQLEELQERVDECHEQLAACQERLEKKLDQILELLKRRNTNQEE